MSDWQRPDGPGAAEDPNDLGVAPPEVSLETTGEIRRRGVGARLAAALLGGILLLGGVGFAATQLGSDDRTAEEAVTDFFAAISDEDVLGVLATLDPGERDALAEPMADLFEELERLEVLDEAFDPADVSGVDLRFDDLAFHTEPVRDDLVRVYLVGGQASFSLDADDLAIGDFVTDTLERFGVDHTGFQESDTTTFDATLDEFLAVRRGAEGWRVSIAYTAAEAARIESDLPAPDLTRALSPIGAETPEAAVEGVVRAMADLDLAGVVARLSPAEMGALQEYWSLLADDAEAVATAGFELDVRDLSLRSETDGDRARVYVDGFDVEVTADGMRLGLTYADGCLTYYGDLDQLGMGTFGEEPMCADDMDALFDESFGSSGLEDMGISVPTFDPVRTPDSFLVARRVGGDWYLAPVSTITQAAVEGLRVIDRSHLDALAEMAESFVTAFTGPGAFGGPMTIEEFDELGTIEELEEFEELGSFDPYAGFPRPGDSVEPPAPQVWDALIAEVTAYTADADQARCVLESLQARATTGQLYEIHDFVLYDAPISGPAEELFYAVLDSCAV